MQDEPVRHDNDSSPSWVAQAVPTLLCAAVVGLAGLFVQVAKVDQALSTVVNDIAELKNDSKERLSNLEDRLRIVELRVRP